MIGIEDYVVIDRKRLFDLLELHYKQSNGQFLAEIGSQIKDVNRIAHYRGNLGIVIA